MHNSGNCWQVSFAPQFETSPLWEEFLEEYFEVVCDNYGDDGSDNYVGYLRNPFDEADFRRRAAGRKLEVPPYCVELLKSDNWLKDNVIRFAPLEVGEFLVYGVHEEQQPQTDRLPLRIYAATAFGSEHQTTKSCLLALSDLYRQNVPHRKILDVGCGSGILSLGAGKLWPRETQVIAVDIDDEAILVTRQNAEDNGLENVITAGISNGYQSPLVKENKPYDLIFANILARPLIEMAPDLAASLRPGGYAILSGFIGEQENWVIDAHIEQGLKLIKIYEMDNWRAALMEKKA